MLAINFNPCLSLIVDKFNNGGCEQLGPGVRQFWFCSFWGLLGVLSVVIPGRPGIVDYSETSMEPQYYKTLTKSLV